MKHRLLAGSLAAAGMSTLLFALAPARLAQDGGPLDPVLEQVSPAQEGGGNVLNCGSFQFQEDAQDELNRNPSDPNGLDAHPGPADGNDQAGGDGIACEHLPRRGTSAPGGAASAGSAPPPVRAPARFTG
jgi:hypothetical protein